MYEKKYLYDINKLEEEPMYTINDINFSSVNEDIPIQRIDAFLYHGIRFQQYLEKLESIFKSKSILAGKYLDNYIYYDDNCNMGEYVSLLKWLGDDNLAYKTFILENISLVVSTLCNAYETKYLDFNTWIDTRNLELKNLYSYIHGEYLCKDSVPLDFIKAIGVPYRKLIFEGKIIYVDTLINDINELMNKYSIDLPIVDTSGHNRLLLEHNKQKYK